MMPDLRDTSVHHEPARDPETSPDHETHKTAKTHESTKHAKSQSPHELTQDPSPRILSHTWFAHAPHQSHAFRPSPDRTPSISLRGSTEH